MLVYIKTGVASRYDAFRPGQIVDVTPERAAQLIRSGVAESIAALASAENAMKPKSTARKTRRKVGSK